jgi:small conductance mechanosensitive channel
MVLPYNTSIPQARELILGILAKNTLVLQQPIPAIIVKEFTETGIKIAIRAWVKTPNYATTVAEILEECLLTFEQNALHIQPFSLTENK